MSADADVTTAPQPHSFQAETRQLLKLMIHSMYSNKEIFLRELISNASDACEKLRFLAVQSPEQLGDVSDLKVTLAIDKDARTLTIADNGVGMNEQDVRDNLGTIARSGTRQFLTQLSGDQKKDSQLIGQFGVGFYSAFIVADKVEVLTRKAGEDAAVRWVSDGEGEFTVAAAEKAERGPSPSARTRTISSSTSTLRTTGKPPRPGRITRLKARLNTPRCCSFPSARLWTFGIAITRAACSFMSSGFSFSTGRPSCCRLTCASCGAWSILPICPSTSRARCFRATAPPRN